MGVCLLIALGACAKDDAEQAARPAATPKRGLMRASPAGVATVALTEAEERAAVALPCSATPNGAGETRWRLLRRHSSRGLNAVAVNARGDYVLATLEGPVLFRADGSSAKLLQGSAGAAPRLTAVALSEDAVAGYDADSGNVLMWDHAGKRRRTLAILRWLPDGAEVESVAIGGGHVYAGLHFTVADLGRPVREKPYYTVLRVDTAGTGALLMAPLSDRVLERPSFRNVPGVRTLVATDGRGVAAGDVWHQVMRIFDGDAKLVAHGPGCARVDLNAAPAPNRPPGAVGGFNVARDVSVLGPQRYSRVVLSPVGALATLEVFDGTRHEVLLRQLPPEVRGAKRALLRGAYGGGTLILRLAQDDSIGVYRERLPGSSDPISPK